MDWLDELPPVTGIDGIVAKIAQRLMDGPVIFKSPFWDGYVEIVTPDDYRAWIRTVERIANELGGAENAFKIWTVEKKMSLY